MKIIIVEDEGITALFLKKSLLSMGHEVAGVHDNANTVLEYLAYHSVDLILMDINIKGKRDGIETATEIYQQYPNTSCVFITSYIDKDTIEKACVVQPLGYLKKPVIFSDIEAILLLVQSHRKYKKTEPLQDIHLGEYTYSPQDKILLHKNTLIKLTKNEHFCLHLLLQNREHHVTIEQLVFSIWGDNKNHASSLRELLSRLRKKMPQIEIINTPSVGYRIRLI
ncbi:MAG: response regulator [Campylobacterota bacterium]|nr:response regulator [Campylobacterota bacterium]